MANGSAYLKATQHPWPCFVFLLPLLLAYEGGVVWLGKAQPEMLRNGADIWVRWGLGSLGLHQLYWAPALIVALFLGWCWLRRGDRPGDLLGVWTGMAIESVAFALGLWALSMGLGPLVDRLGIELAYPKPADQAIGQLVTFVGAGIYEEVLFRLLFYSGLAASLRRLKLAPPAAALSAGAASALLFSLAHHLGPCGEAFDGYVFLFRTLAGFYFALLFQFRGFGIAVGAHACYDVLVGIGLG